MGLFDSTPELKDRFDELIGKLRTSQSGGADGDYSIPIPFKLQKGDFLGSEARWFVDVMGSPYIQVLVRIMLTVLFFLSYLENIPGVGTIIGAALNVMLAGGRALVKTVQSFLPAAVGVLPIPYASMAGLVMSATLGLVVWPILAMVSFSRQDFTSAIDSFVRVIPPPLGNSLADAFLEANRSVADLREKGETLKDDLINAFRALTDTGSKLSSRISEGANVLQTGLQNVPTTPNLQMMTPISNVADKLKSIKASIPSFKPTTGGRRQRFSRKTRRQTKWKTTRRTKSGRHFGNGSR
jgi:hypothetical protein